MNKPTPLLLSILLCCSCATQSRYDRLFGPNASVTGSRPDARVKEAPEEAASGWTQVAPVRFEPRTTAARPSTDDKSHAVLTRELRNDLRSTRIHGLKWGDETSLQVVVQAIVDQTGLPILVHPSAERAFEDSGIACNLDCTNPISVHSTLNAIQRLAPDELVWVVRHEAVIFTTKAKAGHRMSLRMHDIRPLTYARVDFIGPRIDRLRLIDDIEDDDGGGPFGGIGESTKQIEEEDVATLVQDNIAVGTWDDGGVSIEAANGFLIVRHTHDVQVEVARFLDTLGF
tara:strand:+ start:7926 stop:8783 length:858 start_codon:yes stop_codon:yes gene_type:complete